MKEFIEKMYSIGITDEKEMRRIFFEIAGDSPFSADIKSRKEVVMDYMDTWIKKYKTPKLFVITSAYTVENGHPEIAHQSGVLQAIFESKGLEYYIAKTTSLDTESELKEILQAKRYVLYPWAITGELGDKVLYNDIFEYLKATGWQSHQVPNDIYRLLKSTPNVGSYYPMENSNYAFFYGKESDVKKIARGGGKAYGNIWYGTKSPSVLHCVTRIPTYIREDFEEFREPGLARVIDYGHERALLQGSDEAISFFGNPDVMNADPVDDNGYHHVVEEDKETIYLVNEDLQYTEIQYVPVENAELYRELKESLELDVVKSSQLYTDSLEAAMLLHILANQEERLEDFNRVAFNAKNWSDYQGTCAGRDKLRSIVAKRTKSLNGNSPMLLPKEYLR